MREIKRSEFRLVSFTVTNFAIKRNPIKQTKGDITITPSGVINRKAKTFSLFLDVNVKDQNESFNIDMSGMGVFAFKNGISEGQLGNYFVTNAPAIMFPYIRSYISAVTALSGLEAVNLPVMNLTGLQGQLQREITEVVSD